MRQPPTQPQSRIPLREIVIKPFEDIARGTNVTIPLVFKRLDNTPFDLTEYRLLFTMKYEQYDYDYDDLRARVAKDIDIEYPETGELFIHLTSKETWLPPGPYIFELTLEHEYGLAQIGMWRTNIIGGPRNRDVNREYSHVLQTDALWVTMTEKAPIIVRAPLVSNPPHDIIETVQTEPAYLLEELDDPVRNIVIRSFAPRMSFAMMFSDARATAQSFHRFDEFSWPEIPPDAPIWRGGIYIDGRRVEFRLQEHGRMKVWDSFIQHSPEVTKDGVFYDIRSDEPFWVGDNVTHGTLTIHIEYTRQKYIYITGNYNLSRYYEGGSHWSFRIDYFDWDAQCNAPFVPEEEESIE